MHHQSGQCLVRATDNHRSELVARLWAPSTKNLPKPVEIALRARNEVAKRLNILIQGSILSTGEYWISNLSKTSTTTDSLLSQETIFLN
jgi:hypothetical protein